MQPNWEKAADPLGRKNPKNRMYSKDFVGPYLCNNPVAQCISNADLEEEKLIKGKIILSVQEMLEAIETHNKK